VIYIGTGGDTTWEAFNEIVKRKSVRGREADQ
jgi:hypothetical protein